MQNVTKLFIVSVCAKVFEAEVHELQMVVLL
jgi:hypothetical protein